MGEIAEMMLDGTLCMGCGDYLGDEVGFSRYCESCRPPEDEPRRQPGPPSVPRPCSCGHAKSRHKSKPNGRRDRCARCMCRNYRQEQVAT